MIHKIGLESSDRSGRKNGSVFGAISSAGRNGSFGSSVLMHNTGYSGWMSFYCSWRKQGGTNRYHSTSGVPTRHKETAR